MTLTVTIREAEARFSELIAKAETGEDIIIARGAEPVVQLSPLGDPARRRAAVEAILRERDDGARKTVTLEEALAWRREGHRY
jgi:prevent-host-death family protein